MHFYLLEATNQGGMNMHTMCFLLLYSARLCTRVFCMHTCVGTKGLEKLTRQANATRTSKQSCSLIRTAAAANLITAATTTLSSRCSMGIPSLWLPLCTAKGSQCPHTLEMHKCDVIVDEVSRNYNPHQPSALSCHYH